MQGEAAFLQTASKLCHCSARRSPTCFGVADCDCGACLTRKLDKVKQTGAAIVTVGCGKLQSRGRGEGGEQSFLGTGSRLDQLDLGVSEVGEGERETMFLDKV